MQTKTALNTQGRAINICRSAFSQARSPQRGVVQRQGRAPGGAAGQGTVAARADIPTGAEPAKRNFCCDGAALCRATAPLEKRPEQTGGEGGAGQKAPG